MLEQQESAQVPYSNIIRFLSLVVNFFLQILNFFFNFEKVLQTRLDIDMFLLKIWQQVLRKTQVVILRVNDYSKFSSQTWFTELKLPVFL